MTRMIDADGCIKSIEGQANCDTCDNYGGLKCNACQWDDAITSVDDYADAHAVDAVTIEFIREQMDRYGKEADEHSRNGQHIMSITAMEKYFALEHLIENWQKEQGNHNG